MNRKDLTVAVAERSGLTQRSASAFLQAFCDIVCEQVGNAAKSTSRGI